MQLENRKRLAAELLKCSPKKVIFDQSRLDDIQEAITKLDIRGLIAEGAIKKEKGGQQSRVRARKIKEQKKKNQQKGPGSRKGKKHARLDKKQAWMKKIRAQRKLLNEMRESELIDKQTFQKLYLKAKGGFFRNKRHIKLYVEEHGLKKK